MAREIKIDFINFNFSGSNWLYIKDIIGKSVVHALEFRNIDGAMQVRSSTNASVTDPYAQEKIYKLWETVKSGIRGYNIENLQVLAGDGNNIIGEFHF